MGRNVYPHPATPIPHFVLVRGSVRLGWRIEDLILWACVVAVAGLDILITVAGLQSGAAAEGNAVGAAAYDAAGAWGLLHLKWAALLGVLALWVTLPRLRPYVRAGTLAGGVLTTLAVAHNVLLLA